MVGPKEVRLTKVITVHPGGIAGGHNPHPNWAYGGAALQPFNLIIEAEAGEAIAQGTDTYNVYIHAVCLTQPTLPPLALDPTGGSPIAEGFATHPWRNDVAENKYTRHWGFQGLYPQLFQAHHAWMYIVSLIDIAPSSHVACTLASEPFLLT